jgi:hypothetical protein
MLRQLLFLQDFKKCRIFVNIIGNLPFHQALKVQSVRLNRLFILWVDEMSFQGTVVDKIIFDDIVVEGNGI